MDTTMKHGALSTPLKSQVNTATKWSIALSIVMIIAGGFAIGLPQVAGIAVGALIAGLLLFSGFAHLAFGWQNRTTTGVIWEYLLGLVYVGIGVYLVAQPLAGLASLTFALAIYLFLEAILEFVLSYQLRPLPGTGWLVFDGIITLVLAVMIWSTWPSNTPWVIGTLVGISMLFSGVTRLMLSLAVREQVT